MRVFPSQALTFAILVDNPTAAEELKAQTETQELIDRLRLSLPPSWEFYNYESSAPIVTLPPSSHPDRREVTIFGPRVSLMEINDLQKLGHCVRFAEFEFAPR